jgi:hypothetical protein
MSVHTFKEFANERCDLVGRFVKREVPGFQDVDFGIGHIVAIRPSPSDGEGRVVLSPDDQGRGPCLAKPSLPLRIGGDVGPIVKKQRGLNVNLARARKKGVFIGPCVRIVAFGARTGTRITSRRSRLASSCQREGRLGAYLPDCHMRVVSRIADGLQHFVRITFHSFGLIC